MQGKNTCNRFTQRACQRSTKFFMKINYRLLTDYKRQGN